MSQSPTGNDALDKLITLGDPLEKIICRDLDSLQLVLLPYAQVWVNHIYPRRIDNGSFLLPKWQQFGGHHYTAIVRLHHALNAKNEILELCHDEVADDDYDRLLKVHALCAVFWDNLGAAIDNFAHVKVEANRALGLGNDKRKGKEIGADKSDERFVARTVSNTENPKLSYAYERRHQFIHSILVPQNIKNGMIVFNLRHYDDAATTWDTELVEYDHIGSKITTDWDSILIEFSSSWHELFSWLQENDLDVSNQMFSPLLLSPETGLLKDAPLNNAPPPLSGTDIDIPPSGISGR